ncbi:MAG TPA: hypothetical protein VJ820_05220 [Propionibacteriaceae bacterium]|nr:hypothetical protein [Propionibacteriaceae bacterium]
MLADYAGLRAVGRVVGLLIGPWTHGRGLYTRHREVPEHLAAVCCVSALGAVTAVSMLCRGSLMDMIDPFLLAWFAAKDKTCSGTGV